MVNLWLCTMITEQQIEHPCPFPDLLTPLVHRTEVIRPCFHGTAAPCTE